MVIKYIPSGKTYTLKDPIMRDIVNTTDKISPLEQSQYKKFEFQVNSAEKDTIMRYYKHRLSINQGVPVKQLQESKRTVTEIYLPEIGHIKFT